MPIDATTGVYVYDGTEAASPATSLFNRLGDSLKALVNRPWVIYASALVGFTLGTGGVADTVWRREGDLVRVRYKFVVGSGASMFAAGSGGTFALPVAAAAGENYRVHAASVTRAPTSYLLGARIEGSVVRLTTSAAPLGNLAATWPGGGAWAAGDVIQGELTYRPA